MLSKLIIIFVVILYCHFFLFSFVLDLLTCIPISLGFPDSSVGKESTCSEGDLVWEDPLKKEKATHSSILAWRTPWTVQSMGP